MKKFKDGGLVPGVKKLKWIPLLPGERIEVKRHERKSRAETFGRMVWLST